MRVNLDSPAHMNVDGSTAVYQRIRYTSAIYERMRARICTQLLLDVAGSHTSKCIVASMPKVYNLHF